MRIRTRFRTESFPAESSTTKPREDHMMTKRTIRLASLTIAVVFVLGMASRAPVGFAQHVDDPGGCSVKTLEGDYLATGRSDSRDDAPRGTFPHVLVGVHSFDGAGTFVLRSTISRGGVIAHETGLGVYSLDTDCTGTLIYRLDSGGADVHWDIVVTRDGDEGAYVRTDPGTIATRAIKKISRGRRPLQ